MGASHIHAGLLKLCRKSHYVNPVRVVESQPSRPSIPLLAARSSDKSHRPSG